ncbi:MAG: hypothetical protein Q8R24_02810 [Legionellaceae bacterium]|nr:hypothetical protein [Legionellaceae bacterium]
MKTFFSFCFFSMFATTSRQQDPLCKRNSLDCIIDGHIETDQDLVFSAKRNIIIKENASIKATGQANIMFESGTSGNGVGDVIFEGNQPQIFLDDGQLNLYYNPGPQNTAKYTKPKFFDEHVDKPDQMTAFMWVNNVYDLQNIRTYLSGNYALSQDIASVPSIDEINDGRGFQPIFLPHKFSPFSGYLDGRNHTIRNLKIKCGKTDSKNPAFGGCGIFGRVSKRGMVENLVIDNCTVEGDHYVGILFGTGLIENDFFKNITILNSSAKGNALVGRLGGQFISGTCVDRTTFHYENTSIESGQQYYEDELFGALLEMPTNCSI